MNRNMHYPRTGLLGWLNVLKWEGMREVDRRNEKRVNILALGWALGLIAVAACVAFLDLPFWLDWMLAVIPAALGLLCLKSYLKLLREMDEMLRQVQFEAMAVGFGTGLIIGNTLVVLDSFPREWMAPVIVAPMMLAYCLRVVMAARQLARDADEAEAAE